MFNIADKTDGASNLPAAEFNSIKNELENAITDTSQILTGADTHQFSNSMANYVSTSNYYTDSGTANAYVLTSVDSPKKSPTVYRVGMRARFIAGNTNTGPSTVNVAGLGVMSIKMPDGTPTLAGAIVQNKMYELILVGVNFLLQEENMIFYTKATLAANVTVPNIPGIVEVKPTVIEYNIGGCYDVTTGRFTPKVNGLYHIIFSAKTWVNTGDNYVSIYIAKDFTTLPIATKDSYVINTASGPVVTASALVYLTTSEFVFFLADTTDATNAYLQQYEHTYISVYLIKAF